MKQESKTKALIFTSYFLLVVLAGAGLLALYGELHKIAKVQTDTGSKELITVSNVLSTLYEADNYNRFSYLQNNFFDKNTSDSLNQRIRDDVEVLKAQTIDSVYNTKLDSVLVLLDQKQTNEATLYLLMDSIMQLPANQRQLTTILSKRDLSNLETVIRSRDMQIMDSTAIFVRKKTFREKFGDLFNKDSKDSVSLNTTQKRDMVDSIVPIQNTTDTIASFITDFVSERSVKHSMLTVKLSMRQFTLQHTNEVLIGKINFILKDLEDRDAKMKLSIEESKKSVLADSAKIGYWVAFLALIVVAISLALIIQLINRQIRYRKQLEISKAQTESLLVNREQLMVTISHDIKAPLSSIIGYIEILSKAKLSEREHYFLQNMQLSSEQISELVTNLLDFHKLDAGQFVANMMNFSPYTFVNDIYQSFVPVASSRSLKLKLTNEIAADGIYQSDPFRVKQIINNLVSNALKFTKKGNVAINAAIETRDDIEYLIVSVKDTGIGIAAADLQKLFNYYERAQEVEKQNIEGSGLGLAISQKLAHLLGGDVAVVSTQGVGSTFTLRIPLTPVSSEKPTSNAIHTTETAKLPCKILFVDDDNVLLNMYSEMLKQMDCTTTLCNSSVEALALIQDNKFDLVFCDIQMPEMNGFELVERIRNARFARAKELPVVALSARSDVSVETFREAGFTTFLSKPFTLQQLTSVIRESLSLSSDNCPLANGDGVAAATPQQSRFQPLIAFAEDDTEAAKAIVSLFITENEALIETVAAALKAKDWASLQAAAHKLLPRMRIVSDDELVAKLFAIEKGAHDSAVIKTSLERIKIINSEAADFLKTYDDVM